jgi:glutamate-ammonia-ligase adenylyltransferase
VRVTSTLDALEAAAYTGVADRHTCQLLAEGYRFLRRIEHRLRMVHDRSEHVLPRDPVELEKLARRAGYPDAASLNDAFLRWSEELHSGYEHIFATCGLC